MKILGEIELEQRRYRLAVMGSEDNGATAASAGQPIARFEIAGQVCIVLSDDNAPAARETACVIALLSARELQIAALVALGLLNKQIADRLKISEWTVASHLKRIFVKLGVRTRAAMVYRCAGLGADIPNALVLCGPTENLATGLKSGALPNTPQVPPRT